MNDLGLNEPLEIDLDKIPEPEAVEEGTYDLLVTAVEFGMSKAGNPMYTVHMEITSEPNAKTVRHYLPLPTETDDEKSRLNKYRSIKRFAEAAGLPLQGTVLSEAAGQTLTAVLNVDEYKGIKNNKIQTFVKPGV